MIKIKRLLLSATICSMFLVSCDSLAEVFDIKQNINNNNSNNTQNTEETNAEPEEENEEQKEDEVIFRYTVTWLKYDNTEYYSEKVEKDNIPEFNYEKYGIPTKPSNDRYSYVFKEWDPKPSPIKSRKYFRPIFDEVFDGYIATFLDDGGEIIYEKKFFEGETPVFKGSNPTKEEDSDYSYVFDGWEPALEGIKEDTIYRPIFKPIFKHLIVTWYDFDGKTVLAQSVVEKGGTPIYPYDEPSKKPSETTIYKFAKWDPTPSAIYEDQAYMAVYDTTTRKYDISFVNEGSSKPFLTQQYEYNQTPSYPTPPGIESTKYNYYFNTWDKALSAVKNNQTYTAKYTNYPKRGFLVQTNNNNKIIPWNDLISSGYIKVSGTRLTKYAPWIGDGYNEGYLFIDPSITEIGNNSNVVFTDCSTYVKSIAIPPTVKSMSKTAFSGVDKLSEIYIPKQLSSFQSYMPPSEKIYYTGSQAEYNNLKSSSSNSSSANSHLGKGTITYNYKYNLSYNF